MYFAFFMELAIQQQANLSVCVWECPSEREWDATEEKFYSTLLWLSHFLIVVDKLAVRARAMSKCL